MKHHLKQRRWILIPQLLLAAILALTIIIGQSQTSQAASFAAQTNTQECQDPGSLVQLIPVVANGSTIAELDIYYSNVTHYDCAYMRDRGPAWGAASHIDVVIERCIASVTKGSPCAVDGSKNDLVMDSGSYKYYAGPAGVYGEGRCISAVGSITWNGKTSVAATPNASNCR